MYKAAAMSRKPTNTDKLARKFRCMQLELAIGLTQEDCDNIVFVDRLLPNPTCTAEPGKSNTKVHTLSTLEANGLIEPLNVNYLKGLLCDIHRQDLLHIVERYEEEPIFKEEKKQAKKRKEKIIDNPHPVHESLSQELFLVKKATSRKQRLKDILAISLTQVTVLNGTMEMLRREIETIKDDEEISTQAEERFLSVAEDGDKFTRTLRTALSAVGIKSSSSSTSSEEYINQMPLPESASDSPVLQREEQSVQVKNDTTTVPKQKKPAPLPRKKPPQPGSFQSRTPDPIRSTNHQETSSSGLLSTRHIPDPLTTSSRVYKPVDEDNGDFTGGTGDSGIGGDDLGDWIDPKHHSEHRLKEQDNQRKGQPHIYTPLIPQRRQSRTADYMQIIKPATDNKKDMKDKKDKFQDRISFY